MVLAPEKDPPYGPESIPSYAPLGQEHAAEVERTAAGLPTRTPGRWVPRPMAFGAAQVFEGVVSRVNADGTWFVDVPAFRRARGYRAWGPCRPQGAEVTIGGEVLVLVSDRGEVWLVGAGPGMVPPPPGVIDGGDIGTPGSGTGGNFDGGDIGDPGGGGTGGNIDGGVIG